ncbi:MAG: hypothetical protein WBA16_09660, partial [Nonlabens sp.]
DITRELWTGSSNAVKQSLDEILEIYIPNHLTSSERSAPIRILVATNGYLVQNLSLDWTSYDDKVIANSFKLAFWNIDDITRVTTEDYLYDSILKKEDQVLFRKTLMFLDLPEFDHSEYSNLLDNILSSTLSRKREIQKHLRIVRLLLDIIFNWSIEINNLLPVTTLSHITILRSFAFIESNGLMRDKVVMKEFLEIQKHSRAIAVAYFNKVASHYDVEHSINRYAGNHIESNLRCWQELGLTSILAMHELNNFNIARGLKDKEKQEIYASSLDTVGKSMNTLINTYTSLNYPQYDEHLIEINLAMQVLRWCRKENLGLLWIERMLVALHNQFKMKKMFPLFRANHEDLIDTYFGKKEIKPESSMLLATLFDWAVIFDSETTFNKIKEFIVSFERKISIQTWYPDQDTLSYYLVDNYSSKSGNVYSFKKIPTFEEYKKDLLILRERFVKQDEFPAFRDGFEILHSISSYHSRELPMPYLSHRFIT